MPTYRLEDFTKHNCPPRCLTLQGLNATASRIRDNGLLRLHAKGRLLDELSVVARELGYEEIVDEEGFTREFKVKEGTMEQQARKGRVPGGLAASRQPGTVLRRTGEELARRFHETYERLAPQFGYETRKETRAFDPNSPNGRLMIAVCESLKSDPTLWE